MANCIFSSTGGGYHKCNSSWAAKHFPFWWQRGIKWSTRGTLEYFMQVWGSCEQVCVCVWCCFSLLYTFLFLSQSVLWSPCGLVVAFLSSWVLGFVTQPSTHSIAGSISTCIFMARWHWISSSDWSFQHTTQFLENTYLKPLFQQQQPINFQFYSTHTWCQCNWLHQAGAA